MAVGQEIQSPANGLGEAVEDGPSVWNPATVMGESADGSAPLHHPEPCNTYLQINKLKKKT